MRGTYLISIPSDGIYQLSYFLQIDTNVAVTGDYSAFFRDNAFDIWAASSVVPNSSAGSTFLSGSFTVATHSSTFYSINVSNNSGATITVQAGYPKVSVVQLGTS